MYVCHSEGEWARQNILSAFEQGMVVGARRTGLSVSRTAMLLKRTTAALQFLTHSNRSQLSQGLEILL